MAAASLAISFLNPYGWRALWEPFEFALHARHEPLFQGIDELRPFDVRSHLPDELWLPILGWPVLALARLRGARFDVADFLCCGIFTALPFFAQRFFGFDECLVSESDILDGLVLSQVALR